MSKPFISIIVPAHNEAENIIHIYEGLITVLKKLSAYDREIIFVDDGSSDDTLERLREIRDHDKKVKIVELVRNFGKEIATTAGIHSATGHAAIILDADMQHPPELIPKFLQRWQDGAEVVVGVRIPNKTHASWLRRKSSGVFYRILRVMSDTAVTPNATDFRLIDRLVIDEFNRFTERNRLTRGLIDWLGFTHAYVYFNAAKRKNGKAAYSYRKLIRLATNSIVANSLIPLKLAGWIGMIITVISGLMGLFIIVEKYLLGDPLRMHFSGPAELGVLLLFMVGIILICLGLMALYIASIYGEVVNRPLYVERLREPGEEE